MSLVRLMKYQGMSSLHEFLKIMICNQQKVLLWSSIDSSSYHWKWENTLAPVKTETGIPTSRPPALGNHKSSDQNSGSVDDLMEQTTSEFWSSSSDAQQDWTSQIPLSAAFEILPTDIKMESLNDELALTTMQPPIALWKVEDVRLLSIKVKERLLVDSNL
jgi:hypothetical protein